MSLRDARERLHGPLAMAVEECSRYLLASVEEFSATFSRSPHDHVEREGGGNRRENVEVINHSVRVILFCRKQNNIDS